MERGKLIEQLRHALHLAEAPSETIVEFNLANTDFCIELEDPEPVSDIERLCVQLAGIKSDYIRVVAFAKDKEGVLSIFDICEVSRGRICTKKTNKISKAGFNWLNTFMWSDDFSLLEFEQAGDFPL